MRVPGTRLRQSALNHALFDGFDGDAFAAHELDGGEDFLLLSAEKHRHDADLVLNARLADVEADIGKFPAHLPDDWLLDLRSGRESKPAAAGKLLGHWGIRAAQAPQLNEVEHTTGNGGNDADLIPILYRRVEILLKANVFVVE